MGSIDADTPFVLLNWLAELTNVKSLTINDTSLEVLSLVPDLLKVEFHSLWDLKSLGVKTRTPSSIPNGTFDFLLQNSPSAKVKIIDLLRGKKFKLPLFEKILGSEDMVLCLRTREGSKPRSSG
ncbi:hypothetical protein MTR_7g021560 [Medicago truncatula]|uniref:Uncharacterized protein n=1 Tax=Medicago truncatula TaxID=3880 RepID=G7KTS8_MEDTR|nr:hypothetical protein MTR_7g021560 [Medicago truncatula]